MSTITYKDILNNFKAYLEVKWRWLGLPRPTELQFEIADFLQHGGERLLITGFRGIAKSWITAAYCEWCFLRCRDTRFLIVGGNQRKADEISLFIRQSIDNFSVLEPLRWSDWEKQTVRWGIQQFNVKGAPPDIAPSCKASSIGAMLVGSRAHKIIGDDIETPANSDTVEGREKLLAQLGEFESILLPGGDIVLLGTPQTEESVYNVVEGRGYNSRVWPARVPHEHELPIYKNHLSPIIQDMVNNGLGGQPTEPSRFPEDILLQKEAGMTQSAWRLQMMLDSSLSDADRYPIKLRDLMVLSLDSNSGPMVTIWSSTDKYRITSFPGVGFTGDYLGAPMFTGEDWRPYERKFMAVDPSGKGDNETAWVILGTLAGRFFLLDWGGLKDGYSEDTLDQLTLKASEHKVNEVIYEENYGGGMFGQILGAHMKPIYPVAITPVKATGQKELRVLETLEPVIRNHKLVVDAGATQRDINDGGDSRAYSLMYQLSRLTRDRGSLKYDDRVDALSHAIAYVMSTAGVNTKEALEASRLDERRKAIEDLLDKSKMFKLDPAKDAKGLPLPLTSASGRARVKFNELDKPRKELL